MQNSFHYKIPEGIEVEFGFFQFNSLDKRFQKLRKIIARHAFKGRTAYASDQLKVWHGTIETENGKRFCPTLRPIATALKQRVVNIFNPWNKTTRIMMLDIDARESQFAWYYASLPQPMTVTTNPISGKCQYWYLLDRDYGKDELYPVRDLLLNALQTVLNVKRRKGEKGLDYSKPENVRSPFFDPFYVRGGEAVKRSNSTLIKDGKAQADYAEVIVADHFRKWSLADLMIEAPNLDTIDWTSEPLAIGDRREPVRGPVSIRSESIKALPKRRHNPMAGSVGLFDGLRVACYSLYSKKSLWLLDHVTSLAHDLASGESDSFIRSTAKQVFEWITVEFEKSHDPAKAGNGGGARRANWRWQQEREDSECELLSDFAEREGFSRQWASKLKKLGKLTVDGGFFHFSSKMIEFQEAYIEEIYLLNHKQQTTNNNKHVNQGNVRISLESIETAIYDEFEAMSQLSIEAKPPPIPPPKVKWDYTSRELMQLMEG